MNPQRQVRREFRKEIRGELRTLDRAVQELASTIREAVLGIAEAAMEARAEASEEGEFRSALADWIDEIPLHRVGRSRRPALQDVREIAPLLSSPRKPDVLYQARSQGGVEILPPEITRPLAGLICSAILEALGIDPAELERGSTAHGHGGLTHPATRDTDADAIEARECLAVLAEDIEEAQHFSVGTPVRDTADKLAHDLAWAWEQLEKGAYSAALDRCRAAREGLAAAVAAQEAAPPPAAHTSAPAPAVTEKGQVEGRASGTTGTHTPGKTTGSTTPGTTTDPKQGGSQTQ